MHEPLVTVTLTFKILHFVIIILLSFVHIKTFLPMHLISQVLFKLHPSVCQSISHNDGGWRAQICTALRIGKQVNHLYTILINMLMMFVL